MKKFISLLIIIAILVCTVQITGLNIFAVDTPSIPLTEHKGIKVTFGSGCTDADANYFATSDRNGGYLSDETQNGTISKTYTVYNTSTKSINISLSIMAVTTKNSDSTATWAGYSSGNMKTIKAGGYAEFTVSVPVSDGIVAISDCASQALSKFFFRFDIKGVLENDTIVIADNDTEKTMPIELSGCSMKVTKLYTLPDKVEVTATPVQNILLQNGDAENGTTNWSSMNGCTISSVTGGANGTEHAILADNSSASQYGSALFNLAPAILDDSANGYNGGGAGKYNVSFYVKAESGKGGNFNPVLNCKYLKNASDLTKYGELAQSTFISYASFTMTDEWQKINVVMNISQSYIDLIKAIYADGITDAYVLNLRLDGSSTSRAFGTERFNYYIDEVTIEKDNSTPTPTATATATATPTPTATATATPTPTPTPTATPVPTPTPTPTPIYDENTSPVISIDEQDTSKNSTVEVKVEIKNNPGIVSGKIKLTYDTSVFEVVEIVDGGIFEETYHNVSAQYITLSWASDTAMANVTANGVLATIKLNVKDNAPNGEYTLNMEYDYNNSDFCNYDLEKVFFFTLPGKIFVKSVGDIDGDGNIGANDRIILSRYLANWNDYEVNIALADIDKDGIVGIKDRIILSRYLASWEGYDKYFE